MAEDKILADQIEAIHDKLVISYLDNIRTESETLYHYTTLESAHAIISSGQIRFTNALYLNDPTEITNGLEIAERVFSKLITQYKTAGLAVKVDVLAVLYFRLIVGFTLPNERFKISSRLVTELSPLISSAAQNLFNTVIKEDSWSFYIASLSEKGDDLRQWLPYADDARGIAIGFKEFKDNHHSITERNDVWLIRVCYEPNEKKEAYLEAFLIQTLTLLDANRTQNLDQFLMKITELLVADLVACKSEHYRDEAEWRLFFMQTMSDVLGGGRKPEFYLKNGLLKPHHIEKIASGAIIELKLGPRCDDQLNIDAFKMFSYLKLGTVPKVTKSNVKYRG